MLTHVRRLDASDDRADCTIDKLAFEIMLVASVRAGDLLLFVAGEMIPTDGRVVEGYACVARQSYPRNTTLVQLASADDRSEVEAGTRVLSDYLIIRVVPHA